jgi:uncharacterized membrane protein (DUF4010 family)
MFLNLAVALGVGLLIGADRERRNRERASRSAAGIRTFSIGSLTGALSYMIGGVPLLAIATATAGVLTALSYWRTRDDQDPGITTEITLVFTVLAGALAMYEPGLAAGVGVTAAILLAARTKLHYFVGSVLTEREIRDALVLAGATLVVLPLLPNGPMGPYNALNPHSIWVVAVLVLGISATGHVAVRALGARYGLPVVGLASGFISSAAAIGAMGARAKKQSSVLSAAVAGAVLSTVATIIQMSVVIVATSPSTLNALSIPLICAGVAAATYGAVFTIKALRQKIKAEPDTRQAFNLSAAFIFASLVSIVLLAAAALREWFGEAGTITAAALAGLVDAHAAAISIASLVASGRMSPVDAVVPILAGLSTNTITKIIFAATSGGRAFAIRVIPGLILVAASAWLGVLVILTVK